MVSKKSVRPHGVCNRSSWVAVYACGIVVLCIYLSYGGLSLKITSCSERQTIVNVMIIIFISFHEKTTAETYIIFPADDKTIKLRAATVCRVPNARGEEIQI